VPTRYTAVLPLALAAFGLAACSAEAGPTVSGEDLADAAADALEEQIGQRPEVDCGDDSIIVSQDKEVECLLTDPSTGSEFDTTVTFTGVDGQEWDIDVQVASEPNGGAPTESAAAEETSSAPAADEAGLEIPADDLAAAAADALEEQVGSRPEIDCGTGIDITIYEGWQTYCDLIDTDGSVYGVTITVTSIEGTAFDFDIEVDAEPK
jgi:hypothetical protein